VPIEYGDFGKGFVHVLDEFSLERILGELDTIADFVDYLRAKEALIGGGTYPLLEREEDLLAVYLHHGRQFAATPDVLLVRPNAWEELTAKPEWLARKAEDRVSYAWDRLIETFAAEAVATPAVELGTTLTEAEQVVRIMAREDRFARRILAANFLDLLELARAGKVRARGVPSPSGTGYVFLARDAGPSVEARAARRNELIGRCIVARAAMEDGDTVIGIATEQDTSRGFSLDAARVCIPRDAWTAEHERIAAQLREEGGFFATPVLSRQSVSEYSETRPSGG
jgi:hypothetical protein